MRKSIGVLLAFLCFSPFLAAQKTRYAQQGPKVKPGTDYPLTMQIVAVHIRTNCESSHDCEDVAYVDVAVDGRKLELMGNWSSSAFHQTPLEPGSYKARIISKSPNAQPLDLGEKYELALADQSAWRGSVTGISK